MRKKCTACNKYKDIEDFYLCAGKYRSQCKACTILYNRNRQKTKNINWKDRYSDDETRRAYMREYYSKNAEKFAIYRQTFRDKHPGYANDYYNNNKEKYAKK